MTHHEVQDTLDEIRTLVTDPERAHSTEDRLYRDFIRHVALTAPEPWATMARDILTSRAITFPRWCA